MQWRIQDFPEVGVPTYDFAKFSQKLLEIERIWTSKGGVPRGPFRSATDIKVAHVLLRVLYRGLSHVEVDDAMLWSDQALSVHHK